MNIRVRKHYLGSKDRDGSLVHFGRVAFLGYDDCGLLLKD